MLSSSVEIIEGGSAYVNGETLNIDNTATGGSGAQVTIATVGITTNIGDVLQITGIGTASDALYRIATIPSTTQVSVALTAGSPDIFANQFAINQAHLLRSQDHPYLMRLLESLLSHLHLVMD